MTAYRIRPLGNLQFGLKVGPSRLRLLGKIYKMPHKRLQDILLLPQVALHQVSPRLFHCPARL